MNNWLPNHGGDFEGKYCSTGTEYKEDLRNLGGVYQELCIERCTNNELKKVIVLKSA